MNVYQQVARLRQNVVESEGVGVKLNLDPSAFVAEHMSMEVPPWWNLHEGWFRKDVVQPTEALAVFTPYLASVAMCGPFEHGGSCGPRSGPTPATTVVIRAYGGGR